MLNKLFGVKFDGDTQISNAERRVKAALSLFDYAAREVEKANINLDKTVAKVEADISAFEAKIAAANSTKNNARNVYEKNKKVISKLRAFIEE